LILVDLKARKIVRSWDDINLRYRSVFSADGRRCFVGGELIILNHPYQPIVVLHINPSEIVKVCLDHTGSKIAVLGGDETEWLTMFNDDGTTGWSRKSESGDIYEALILSHCGRYLLTQYVLEERRDELSIWDLTTPSGNITPAASLLAIDSCFSSDKCYLVILLSGDNMYFKSIQLATGSVSWTILPRGTGRFIPRCAPIAGDWFAVSTGGANIYCIESRSSTIVSQISINSEVLDLAVNGGRVTVVTDQGINSYEIDEDGEFILTGFSPGTCDSVAIHGPKGIIRTYTSEGQELSANGPTARCQIALEDKGVIYRKFAEYYAANSIANCSSLYPFNCAVGIEVLRDGHHTKRAAIWKFDGENKSDPIYLTDVRHDDPSGVTSIIADIHNSKLIWTENSNPVVLSVNNSFARDLESLVNIELDKYIRARIEIKKRFILYLVDSSAIARANLSQDGRHLILIDSEGSVSIFDADEGLFIVAFPALSDPSEFLCMAEGPIWWGSVNPLLSGHVVVNGTSFEMAELESRQRPDKILERLRELGAPTLPAASALIKEATDNRPLPISTMLGDGPPIRAADGPIAIRATTSIFVLLKQKTLNCDFAIGIAVNGVPLTLGSISLDEKEAEIHIPLREGDNIVEAWWQTKKDRSRLTNLYIKRIDKAINRKVFIVSIGISKYSASTLDLPFAAKDACDLINLYNDSITYSDVESICYQNSQFSLDCVREISDMFDRAGVDDLLMIYYAGHGFVHEGEYFISTSQTDPSYPRRGGISYEMIVGILTNAKCGQKLMILDACNAGASHMRLSRDESLQDCQLLHRGGSVASLNPSFEDDLEVDRLISTLFVDLRHRSGAVVLAASAAQQSAFESKKWENGALIHALHKIIGETLANSKGLMVSEVTTRLKQHVNLLTQGAQTPNARERHARNDFYVF
jgi:hypothetical protein